jgi:hypothetical protein
MGGVPSAGGPGRPRLERAYQHLLRWQRLDGGWHPNQEALPGGTREREPSCPFGTGNMLRALVVHPEHQAGVEARRAGEYLLAC